jgi:hypothetical protein
MIHELLKKKIIIRTKIENLEVRRIFLQRL